MRMSDETDKLTEALAKASASFDPIETNRTGAHSARYADLSAILASTRPHLAAEGLALIQMPKRENGALILVSRLSHASGQWMECEYPLALEATKNPQAIGSAITYARRYVAAAMLNVAAEQDDDDGEAAVAGEAKVQPAASRQLKADDAWEAVTQSLWATNTPEEAQGWMKRVKANQESFNGSLWKDFPKKWKDAVEEAHAQHYDGLCQRALESGEAA